RRHGIWRPHHLRPRGLVAGAAGVSRDLVGVELRRLPGASDAGALPAREGQARTRAHAQRIGPRGGADPRRHAREPPAARRQHRDTGGVAAVAWRRGAAGAVARLERPVGTNPTSSCPASAAFSAILTGSTERGSRKGGRVVECAGLEIRYTGFPYRGFEALPFRQRYC